MQVALAYHDLAVNVRGNLVDHCGHLSRYLETRVLQLLSNLRCFTFALRYIAAMSVITAII